MPANDKRPGASAKGRAALHLSLPAGTAGSGGRISRRWKAGLFWSFGLIVGICCGCWVIEPYLAHALLTSATDATAASRQAAHQFQDDEARLVLQGQHTAAPAMLPERRVADPITTSQPLYRPDPRTNEFPARDWRNCTTLKHRHPVLPDSNDSTTTSGACAHGSGEEK